MSPLCSFYCNPTIVIDYLNSKGEREEESFEEALSLYQSIMENINTHKPYSFLGLSQIQYNLIFEYEGKIEQSEFDFVINTLIPCVYSEDIEVNLLLNMSDVQYARRVLRYDTKYTVNGHSFVLAVDPFMDNLFVILNWG